MGNDKKYQFLSLSQLKQHLREVLNKNKYDSSVLYDIFEELKQYSIHDDTKEAKKERTIILGLCSSLEFEADLTKHALSSLSKKDTTILSEK